MRALERIFGPPDYSDSMPFTLGGTMYNAPFGNSSWRLPSGYRIYVDVAACINREGWYSDSGPMDNGHMGIEISNMASWEKAINKERARAYDSIQTEKYTEEELDKIFEMIDEKYPLEN